MRDGVAQVPLDVRQDAEVLLDARAQLAALAAPFQRQQEVPPRVGDRAGLDVQPPECVQRFRGEQAAAGVRGHAVAAAAQLPRLG